MVVTYHSEESALDDVQMSLCIWCEVSVSNSRAHQHVTCMLIPYGKPVKSVKY